MIQQITIAVDFSETSDLAARFGVGIARALGAHASLVHVLESLVPLPGPAGTLEKLEGGMLASRNARAYELMLELGLVDEPDRFSTTIRRGDVSFGILNAASDQRANLLVIGSTGAHQEDLLVLGSVAARVACQARCPVLVVSANHAALLPDEGLFRRPLIAVDYSRLSDPSLAATAMVCDRLAPIELCHALFHPAFAELGDPDSEALEALFEETRAHEHERLREFAERSRIKRHFVPHVEHGRAAYAIAARAASIGADLITTGAHGRSTSNDLALGSVAGRLLRTSPSPVLLIPDGAVDEL